MNEHSSLRRDEEITETAPRAERIEELEKSLEEHSIAAPVALDAAAGAAAGAIAGTIAGPIGMAIGAMIGGFVGGAAGVAVETSGQQERAHDEQLDRDIGVSGGDLGEAPPNQKPSRGRFHAAAVGSVDAEPESSDGPIQNVDGA